MPLLRGAAALRKRHLLFMHKVKNLVVGAGLSGAVLAERIATQLKEEVLVIDRRAHVAGNVYDFKHACGITVQRYGPHIFRTDNKQIWDYLSTFTAWHKFCLHVSAWVDGRYIVLPFNLHTLYQVFAADKAAQLEKKLLAVFGLGAKVPVLQMQSNPDEDLRLLGQYVYEKIFANYTRKQWGKPAQEVDPAVLARVPVHISRDDGYFQEAYQAIPARGYTHMVENMLRHPLITVQLNTSFEQIKNNIAYERLFYTGPIDAFFDCRFGPLPYRSLRFEIEQKNTEYFQPTAVVNYPNDFAFTRVCEHKYFLDEKAPVTVVSFEYPQAFKPGENEPYYPINNPQTDALYQQYAKEAAQLPGVYFYGRLGGYKYYSMEQAVAAALDLFEKIKQK